MANKTLIEALQHIDEKFKFTSSPDKFTICDDITSAKLCLGIELHITDPTVDSIPAAQAVLSIVLQNTKLWSWGASNDADNLTIINWFLKHQGKARENEYQRNSQNQKRIKDHYNL